MTAGREATSPRQGGLSVELVDGARGDLVLKLGTSRFQGILEPDDPDFAAGGRYRGPAHTLDQWVAKLERLAAGDGPAMLPFNFSDECTGWLRVGRSHDDLVDVQAGWSRLGQYDFDPAEFVTVGGSLPDFTPVPNARIERPLADVIAAVTASRDELARCFHPNGTIVGERRP